MNPPAGYELHITYWNAAQNKWIDLGGVQNSSTSTVTTPSTVNQYGYFTLALVYVGFLPVESTPLDAALVKRDGVLTWKTYSEVNNKGFEIQKTINGIEWENIGWVNGAGNSSNEITYSFVDYQLSDGLYYYRYRQIDQNGESKFSNIVSLAVNVLNQFGLFSLYPNPVQRGNSVYVKYSNNVELPSSLILYDIMGRKIESLTYTFSKENSMFELNLPQVFGTYYIEILSVDGVKLAIFPVIVQ